MDAVTLLRAQFQTAHQFMEETMADVTPAMAHWLPPGRANPLGASYAHVLFGEDMIIQGVLKQTAPLFAGSWADRLGVSEPMPMPSAGGEEYYAWTHRVQVDLDALRAYGQAVYAATDEYVAALTPADLDRLLDLSSAGMGEVNLAWVVSNLAVGHIHDLMGEISCLKGLQGARGYPF
jgi:hypothetical protein